MRNIKLILQYDGSAYHGWQIQPNAVTVQDTVERAIKQITGVRSALIGCGRTDSGVHADRYVCNFFSDTAIPIERIPHALNSILPEDIVCKGAEDMPKEFHSKNCARKKRYVYRIFNSPVNDVFMRRYAWHYKFPLDIESMRTAAGAFVGTHDFLGFAAAGFTVKTTVRTIFSLDIDKYGDLVEISVVGDGFLYNMVRIIAGTLLYVGCGKISACDISGIIASRDRKRAGITAPSHGLCLSEVYY
ncbi:MAG: tRNA pseudouridine(38-40) synthase TruA [Clostridia bacterium]|nr:tRNA pseudouridine(38-40) synthase TruA [Clostridia bacterium]